MTVGRNDPCPCGSGRKYKQCCLNQQHPESARINAQQNRLTQAMNSVRQGQWAKAEEWARPLLHSTHHCANAAWILGYVCLQQQRWLEALSWLKQSRVNGQTVVAEADRLWSQAMAEQGLGNLQPMLSLMHQALTERPDWPEARLYYAGILLSQRHYALAQAQYRLLLDQQEGLRDAWVGLGLALKQQGDLRGWLLCWQQLCQRHPEDIAAAHTLGRLALAYGHYDLAEARFALAAHTQPDNWTSASSLLYVQNYRMDRSTSEKRRLAQQWGEQCSQLMIARHGTAVGTWTVERNPVQLRIGLVSGDLRKHPVGYFLEAMLEHLDYTTIQLVAIDNAPQLDALSERIRPYFSSWHRVFGQSDAEIVAVMRSLNLHLLIDLSGHTRHTLMPLFACRPAPVQVAWLGYFASTGLPEIDAVVVDHWVEPEDAETVFCEERWYLPETYRCFSPPEEDVAVSPLPALERGHLSFGCFNHLSKLHPGVWAVWGQILRAVPTSRLIIKTGALDEGDDLNSYRRYLEHLGLPTDRIELRTSSPRREYLASFADIDISLDPFPFTGGTVSVESLWMGVPVLSMQGRDFLSRSASNILGVLQLDSWICADETAYVHKAIELANSWVELVPLRLQLRQRLQKSPLMDAPRFARNWQTLMWNLWQHKGSFQR